MISRTGFSKENALPILALQVYYEPILPRIAEIQRFFGISEAPTIITITRGSEISVEAMVAAFPNAHIALVENEFDGYQQAAEVAATRWPGRRLLLANDSLGRHFRLWWFRRCWFQRALRKAGQIANSLVVSEHYVGNPRKFPATAGTREWFTSNYFCTDAPAILASSIAAARQQADAIPPEFRRIGEQNVATLFQKRGVSPTAVMVENKLRRIWIEMSLFYTVTASGLTVVPASGRNLINRVMHAFFDR